MRHTPTNYEHSSFSFSYKNSCLFSEEVVYFLKVTKIRAFQQLLKNLTYNYTTLFVRCQEKTQILWNFPILRNTFFHV